MAQEFSQKKGVDYHEVFSPVVKHKKKPIYLGWFCLMLASFLTLRDVPLTASLR